MIIDKKEICTEAKPFSQSSDEKRLFFQLKPNQELYTCNSTKLRKSWLAACTFM